VATAAVNYPEVDDFTDAYWIYSNTNCLLAATVIEKVAWHSHDAGVLWQVIPDPPNDRHSLVRVNKSRV